MSYHNLEQKLADAIKQVIVDAGTDIPAAQIYTDYNDQTESRVLPCVSISNQGGEEDGHNSGNYMLRATVSVESTADSKSGSAPRTVHSGLCAAVFDVINDDAFYSSLSSAVSDFTAFNAVSRVVGPTSVEDRRFITSVDVQVPCCPSDIS